VFFCLVQAEWGMDVTYTECGTFFAYGSLWPYGPAVLTIFKDHQKSNTTKKKQYNVFTHSSHCEAELFFSVAGLGAPGWVWSTPDGFLARSDWSTCISRLMCAA